jgi:hypothetical protein
MATGRAPDVGEGADRTRTCGTNRRHERRGERGAKDLDRARRGE